ncbi:pro-Pol polyprotein [Trichonephila clavipes]|nr:pro-Pol polyprotein [Trichonephila clavipes]
MRKDIKNRVRACEKCQRAKVFKYTKAPLSTFALPDARFAHIHIDYIGPYPPSKGYKYCLTIIDRIHSASYHPQSNGMIERFHRHLKSAIIAHEDTGWTDILPIVLLGLRSAMKNDIKATSSELVYGTTLRLPSDLISSESLQTSVTPTYVSKLITMMRKLSPISPDSHSYDDRFNSCQVIYSQFGLAIHQTDHQARRRFVEWAEKEIAVVPDFHKRNLFSDEAHFWLNCYVNKQKCRILSEANPQVYVETPLHREKLTVWCALWAGGIIGPYFFKNDEGHNVTVNARATIDLLKDTFGDRLIPRFRPVNWPPISCDVTPLDYFLWGYVKSLVYADKPQTLDHLEDNIRRVIADIRPQMLKKSSKIGRPDWTTYEPAVAVLCQKSYLKSNATRLSFE